MKIQFDPDLQFQRRAIDSIAGIFVGQEIGNSRFTVSALPGADVFDTNEGTGNRLKLLDVVEGIAKPKEELEPDLTRVIFRDSGYKDDVVKTNAAQILKQHGIEDVRSI